MEPVPVSPTGIKGLGSIIIIIIIITMTSWIPALLSSFAYVKDQHMYCMYLSLWNVYLSCIWSCTYTRSIYADIEWWWMMSNSLSLSLCTIWRFPKMGVPQIIHFNGTFHEINPPAIGVPPWKAHPNSIHRIPCPSGIHWHRWLTRCFFCAGWNGETMWNPPHSGYMGYRGYFMETRWLRRDRGWILIWYLGVSENDGFHGFYMIWSSKSTVVAIVMIFIGNRIDHGFNRLPYFKTKFYWKVLTANPSTHWFIDDGLSITEFDSQRSSYRGKSECNGSPHFQWKNLRDGGMNPQIQVRPTPKMWSLPMDIPQGFWKQLGRWKMGTGNIAIAVCPKLVDLLNWKLWPFAIL